MKTFSIRSLLLLTLIFALVGVCLFTPFRFEYPLRVNKILMNGDESLVLLVSVGDGIVEEVEIPEYQLTDLKTHVIKKMTLVELVLFEWQDPIYELNPDRPTMCGVQ